MTPKQTYILIISVVLLFALMGAVVYYMQSDGGAAKLNTAKRFTAKPGTTRENAVALSSNKRPSQLTGEEKASESGKGRPIPVRSISPKEEEKEAESAKKVRQALNMLSPEAGIESIEKLLETPQNPEDAAEYQAALGILYTQLDPPDYEKAHTALDKARTLATTEAQICKIAEAEASIFISEGLFEEAWRTLVETLTALKEVHEGSMRLMLLLGHVQEEAGAPKEAEQAYRQVLKDAKALWTDMGEEAQDITRVAGLRLTRLFRKTNRPEEAKKLTQRFTQELKRLEEDLAENP